MGTHPKEHYSAVARDELLIQTTTRVSLQIIMLSVKSCTGKGTHSGRGRPMCGDRRPEEAVCGVGWGVLAGDGQVHPLDCVGGFRMYPRLKVYPAALPFSTCTSIEMLRKKVSLCGRSGGSSTRRVEKGS